MCRLMRFPAVALLISTLCTALPGRAARTSAEIVWLHSLSEAMKQGSARNTLIVVDLVADWCGWCKLMEKETWSQPSVAALGGKYVFLRLNVETDPDGIALSKRFRIADLPTVLLLTAQGNEFARLREYLPAEEFLDKLKTELADPDSPGNMRAAHLKDPQNVELHFRLAYELFDRGDYQESGEHFSRIVEQDAQNKSGRTDAAMFYLAVCKASRSENEGCLALLDRLRKEMPGSNVVPSSYLLSGQVLLRTGKRTEAREKIQEFLDKYPAHPLVPKAREMLAQIRYP